MKPKFANTVQRSAQRAPQGVSFASSPLLASKTPLWRSKLILVLFGAAFAGLGARAAYVQVIHQNFYQRQGEIRFARTLDIPASRGRVLDRNDQIMASNVPALSVWAIPEDLNRSLADQPDKLTTLAKLLGMRVPELQKKLAEEDRSFVWLRRQLDGSLKTDVEALKIEGLHTRMESRRQYPEGDAATQVVGLLNNDEIGRAHV